MPGFEGEYHGHDQALFGKVVQDVGGKMSPLHDVLANDDHVVVGDAHRPHLERPVRRCLPLPNARATEHWHLAANPKAGEAFWAS
jgi:hypothetical protein